MDHPSRPMVLDVPFNHLVALRDVTWKQSYPREAQQIDQFELPVSDDDLRNWVRQGREAALISSRENLRESIYQPDSGFDWLGQTLTLRDGFGRAAFGRIVGKTTPVQVISSQPPPITGPVEASMESLRAGPLGRLDRSLPWGECWVLAKLSHPTFYSARDLTACAGMLRGHALDVVEV